MSSEIDVDKQNTLSNEVNLTKYKTAAEITNITLKLLLKKCSAGETPLEICELGDSLIKQQCENIYRNKKDENGKPLKRGCAFPVCVSVNDCICNFSPLKNDVEIKVLPLEVGDVVKIELGVHVDGFITMAAATTIVLPESDETQQQEEGDEMKNKKTVIMAALNGAQAALACLQTNKTSEEVEKTVNKISEIYGVKIIPGFEIITRLRQFVIDEYTEVGFNNNPDEKKPVITFENDSVWQINVIMSTGGGKLIQKDARTTVFKKNLASKYDLKLRASRNFLSSLENSPLAFSLRQMEDETQARLGVKECIDHQLLTSYPVLYEKNSQDVVAQFKYTFALLPNGNRTKLCGVNYEENKAVFSKNLQLVLPSDMKELMNKAEQKKSSTNNVKKPAAEDEVKKI